LWLCVLCGCIQQVDLRISHMQTLVTRETEGRIIVRKIKLTEGV
jgi:hypothetical protein